MYNSSRLSANTIVDFLFSIQKMIYIDYIDYIEYLYYIDVVAVVYFVYSLVTKLLV